MNAGHVYAMNASSSSRRNRNAQAAAATDFSDFNALGSVSSPEELARQRERQGYCTTCRNNPMKLFDIKKNKLNPLRRTKEPRTVTGQSFNGQCLVCYPNLDPNRRTVTTSHRTNRSLRKSDSRSTRSTRGSSDRSMDTGSHGSGDSPTQSPMSSGRSLRVPATPSAETSPRSPAPPTSRTRSPPDTHRSPRPPVSRIPPPPLTSRPSSQRTPTSTYSQSQLSDHSGEIHPQDLAMPCENRQTSSSDVLHFSGSGLDYNSSHSSARAHMNDSHSSFMRASNNHSRDHEQSLNLDYNHSVSSRNNASSFQESGSSSVRFEAQQSERSMASLPLSALAQSRAAEPNARDATRSSTDQPAFAGDESFRTEAGNSFMIRAPAEDDQRVVELKLLIKDMGGNAEFTADVLADAIRSHPNSEPMQIFFLQSVCDVCKHNEDNKSLFISMGLHDDVLNLMEKNLKNARLQELGCAAVWTLGVNDRSRRYLAKAGAADCVFRALAEHENDEKVAKKAVSALRTLSPDKEIQQELAQYQCAKKVAQVMALHRSVADIQRDGCAFLSNAAIDMDTKTVSVVPYEGMKAVVRAMGYHTKTDKVTSSACFALKNYTYEEENFRTMRRFGDLRSLLTDISNYANSTETRDNALDILEGLDLSERLDSSLENVVFSSFHDAMEGPDAVSNVMGIINEYDWSPMLTCQGLASLASLLDRPDVQRRQIAESDVLKEILECMNRHESNGEIQKQSCNVLRRIASDARGRSMVCRAAACASILNAMKECRDDGSVQEAALMALRAIATEVQFESEQQENELMAAINESLQHYPDNAQLQRVGTDVVTAFSARWT